MKLSNKDSACDVGAHGVRDPFTADSRRSELLPQNSILASTLATLISGPGPSSSIEEASGGYATIYHRQQTEVSWKIERWK